MLDQGALFQIQKFSIHDGPGIRTTVFFKGCPLTCWWCHNPESWKKERELLYYKDRCILCGLCIRDCPTRVLSIDGGDLKKGEGCILCGQCAKVCPKKAHELVGEIYTVAKVMKEIEKDIIFYDESGGGVTFSGGEPFMQPSFLESLLKKCKERGIHTAIDTSGYAPLDVVKKIAPLTDLFLFDLKLGNPEEHKCYTGVNNSLILTNLQYLSQQGSNIILRIPIISGINDDIATIEELGILLRHYFFASICLLPYHLLGKGKYSSLKRSYRLKGVSSPSKERLEEIKRIFDSFGYLTKIGG